MGTCAAPRGGQRSHSIAQTEQERYQGAPDEVLWGERFPSGKLCHDVGEQEGEATQVLLGWSGPRKVPI